MFGPSATPWIVTDAANLGYWTGQSLDAGTTVQDGGATLGFSKVSLVWDRTTPVGTREDVMVCGMSWAQRAAAVVTPLSTSDKAVVETALVTWASSLITVLSNQYTLREFRWYDYQPINSRPGPVDRVTASGQVGTVAAARVPDQLAMTQTFKSASRKHWGRWYLPFPGIAAIDTTYGRITNARVSSVQGYTRTLLQTVGGSGLIHPVVTSVTYHAVMGIKELQTDNLADVIRSRRAKVATNFSRNTS